MEGGNIKAIVLQYNDVGKNLIGEGTPRWTEIGCIFGWLDSMSADDDFSRMKTTVQDSTHVFIMDYDPSVRLGSKNSRLLINGRIYEVKYQDDPMELHDHIEIYLKYAGEEYASQIY